MLRSKKSNTGVVRGISSKTTMPPNQSKPKASKLEMNMRAKITNKPKVPNTFKIKKTGRNYSM